MRWRCNPALGCEQWPWWSIVVLMAVTIIVAYLLRPRRKK